ncbi:SDR family NAD(P)-dependent oxidoreductase [Geomonas sp. RF6]|uniref:SDR family NAD(P)-dependent oxidoreductase n=1 Tax=Geomonas sp. RF6 TaxID=2897342 RepID=UPI001E5BC4F7|nr:SDR family NAD(P)-dependent oxidoreductase [Geomonas sp. RF6]UFS71099.1 SDR family NAD(P)-dependent oxidoreductase [Geomonas sp. RF6]
MKKAIIIGASSGIGRELATVMSRHGYVVGIAARRLELLRELQKELPTESHVKIIDVTRPAEAMAGVRELISEMGGTDAVVVSSGISIHNPPLRWESEKETLEVNVVGFTAMMNVAFNYFCERGGGHIVGISSFRGLRGGGSSPAYNASKAYQSNYLEGLRVKSRKLGKMIDVTDIRPGLVVTPMTAGRSENLLVAPVAKAARQIFQAIERHDTTCYVTKRYRLVACLLRAAPYSLYSRI